MRFRTLDDAIVNAISEIEDEVELSPSQVIEFLERYRGVLSKQPVMLMHEIIDCGCSEADCAACNGTGTEYTEVFDDDIAEGETVEDFVSGFEQWWLWARDQ